MTIRHTLAMLFLAVLPLAGHTQSASVSLAGEWLVRLDPGDRGADLRYFDRHEGAPIRLPGTLDEAGYGTPTEGSDYGILTRKHKYIGPAWYTRRIEIPREWEGQETELFLERVMWSSEVWIDGRKTDTQEGLGTPHIHRLGRLEPGSHLLAVRIDNDMLYNIGDKGHGYGEYTQIIWNGAVGRVELRPVSRTGRIRVWPDPATNSVEATFDADGSRKRYRLSETGSGRNIPFRIENERPGAATLRLLEPAQRWDEFSPALYTLEITSGRGRGKQTERLRFGFRTIENSKSKILVNDRPVFLRGNLDCVHFPLTGYPSCDPADWERIFRIYKAHGLNHVRFHSWCPPEAAFAAADKLGIYIQAEVLWIDWWMSVVNPDRPEMTTRGLPEGLGHNPSADTFVPAELRRMLDAYGNHPSFTMLCIGNELGNSDFGMMQRWIDSLKADDPRRLYAVSTARQITPADQYMATHHYPGAGNTYGLSGEGTAFDWEQTYSRTAIPTIAHELGQYPVYPLWSEIGKYTGVLEARNLEGFRAQARRNHIERLDSVFRRASGALQTLLYKANIEALLRTPSCAGYQLLSMTDYSGQGEALVGWLDSFWDPKGIVSPETFREYGGAVVPLARFDRYVWESGRTFSAAIEVANYGPDAVPGVLSWTLSAPGDTLGRGELSGPAIERGRLAGCGRIEVPLEGIDSARQYTLTVAIAGTPYRNRWNIWVYPPCEIPQTDVLVTDTLDGAARQRLAGGGRVLLLAHRAGNDRTTTPLAFTPLFWSNSFFPGQTTKTLGLYVDSAHPVLSAFPTADHSDWQWEPLCRGRAFVVNEYPGLRPIVQPISDFHINDKLASLFECRVGQGLLMVCGHDLTGGSPAIKQLKYSLLRYMNTSDFSPKAKLTLPDLQALLGNGSEDGTTSAVRYEVICDGKKTAEGPWSGHEIEVLLKTPNGILGDLQVVFADRSEGTLEIEGRKSRLCAAEAALFVMREDTNDGRVVFRATAEPGGMLTLTRIELVAR